MALALDTRLSCVLRTYVLARTRKRLKMRQLLLYRTGSWHICFLLLTQRLSLHLLYHVTPFLSRPIATANFQTASLYHQRSSLSLIASLTDRKLTKEKLDKRKKTTITTEMPLSRPHPHPRHAHPPIHPRQQQHQQHQPWRSEAGRLV